MSATCLVAFALLATRPTNAIPLESYEGDRTNRALAANSTSEVKGASPPSDTVKEQRFFCPFGNCESDGKKCCKSVWGGYCDVTNCESSKKTAANRAIDYHWCPGGACGYPHENCCEMMFSDSCDLDNCAEPLPDWWQRRSNLAPPANANIEALQWGALEGAMDGHGVDFRVSGNFCGPHWACGIHEYERNAGLALKDESFEVPTSGFVDADQLKCENGITALDDADKCCMSHDYCLGVAHEVGKGHNSCDAPISKCLEGVAREAKEDHSLPAGFSCALWTANILATISLNPTGAASTAWAISNSPRVAYPVMVGLREAKLLDIYCAMTTMANTAKEDGGG